MSFACTSSGSLNLTCGGHAKDGLPRHKVITETTYFGAERRAKDRLNGLAHEYARASGEESMMEALIKACFSCMQALLSHRPLHVICVMLHCLQRMFWKLDIQYHKRGGMTTDINCCLSLCAALLVDE